jgi:hypothetical protein
MSSTVVLASWSPNAQVKNFKKSTECTVRIQIEPAFVKLNVLVSVTRVVIRVTHFNKKIFIGFVSSEDAKT